MTSTLSCLRMTLLLAGAATLIDAIFLPQLPVETAIAIRTSDSTNKLPLEVAQVGGNSAVSTKYLISRSAITCSEEIGGQPIACGISICGGESTDEPGYCNIINGAGTRCQCLSAVSAIEPVYTTVIVTQADKTATGIFALETISAYSNLKQNITTTILSTSTATDGSVGVETAVAVIMAGGVAWLLAVAAGDPIIIEPPAGPEGDHKNDEKCPLSKQKCSDCTGVLEMCTTGSFIGCACDSTQSCPSTPPTCEEADCVGTDGKCTVENYVGCECSSTACLEGEYTPFCSECGGGDSSGQKCTGLANKNGLYKDCGCMPSNPSPFLPYTPFLNGIPADWASTFANLQPLTDASYYVPEVPASCQKAGWGAPQRDNDGTPSVTSSFNDWCAAMDGKTVTRQPNGVDTVSSMYKISFYSFWLSASNWYYSPAANKCGDTVTITKQECILSFTRAMDKCDPNSGTTHGGSESGNCINYNITLDGGTDPQSPPWNRLPSTALPTCDATSITSVASSWFKGLYPNFCAGLPEDVSQPRHQVLTVDSWSQQAIRRQSGNHTDLFARAGTVSNSDYVKYNFTMDWTGGSGTCRMDCKSAYAAIVDSSCGGSAAIGMAKSASIDVGCGTYSYNIDVPTGADFTTCQPGLTPPVGQHCEPGQQNCRQPSVWPRSVLLAAAHQYCFPSFGWVAVTPYVNYGDAVAWYGWFDTKVIDPVTNLPGYCNGQQGQFQWPDHDGSCGPGGTGKNSKAALQVNPSADQSYCSPMKDHTLPTGQACVDMFTHVIDKCVPEGNVDGTGGYYTEYSRDGCWDWWVFGIQL